jgi:serine/threonine-protein kinase
MSDPTDDLDVDMDFDDPSVEKPRVNTAVPTVVVDSGKHPKAPAPEDSLPASRGGPSPESIAGGAKLNEPVVRDEDEDEEFPQRLGRYTLTQRIGVGGMAEVFKALQDGPAGFQKTVVIKRMLPHLAQDDRFVDMFLREARVAAGLTHSNIVQIYELGQEGRHYYIAMEFVDGISLHSLARRAWRNKKAIPMELILAAVADAASGLHYANTTIDPSGEPLGLVHRDISPDNLMVNREGVTKILDFGIAKGTSSKNVTKTGDVKGKIPFMAPEQLHGMELDHRADLYALGVTFYWLLTGRRPFSGDTDLKLMQAIISAPPSPPTTINSTIPPVIEQLVMQLLAKDRDERPRSGAVLANQLRQHLSAERQYTQAFVTKIVNMESAPTAEEGASPDGFVPASPTTDTLVETAGGTSSRRTPASEPSGPMLRVGADASAGTTPQTSSGAVPIPTHDDDELPLEEPKRSRAPMVGAAVGLLLLAGVGAFVMSGRE